MKIGIIGHGHIGTAMAELFKDAIIYDKYKGIGSKQDINSCDFAFICVPTPMAEDGSCDTSIVEEVISWCDAKIIVIRSTVKVGFSREMRVKYGKRIIFQPEFYGETPNHPYADLSKQQWIILGGDKDIAIEVDKLYKKVMKLDYKTCYCNSDEAEMMKYMDNSFLATKVVFANEMYDICKSLNLDYFKVRDLWLMDSRIGSSHTFVYEDNRGFGGSCLPKDIASLEKQAKDNKVDTTLISAVIEKNKKLHNK